MTHRAALAIAAMLLAAACTPSESLSVTNAWLRPPAPGLTVAAGYFDIVNRAATPIDIVGARTDAAGSIQIHTGSGDGEMMQMRRLDNVTLAPQQTVSFGPGGMHLMLFQFTGTASKQIPITLLFSDGSQRTVPFDVRTLTGESSP